MASGELLFSWKIIPMFPGNQVVTETRYQTIFCSKISKYRSAFQNHSACIKPTDFILLIFPRNFWKFTQRVVGLMTGAAFPGIVGIEDEDQHLFF